MADEYTPNTAEPDEPTFSDKGKKVDVSAPGMPILSTLPDEEIGILLNDIGATPYIAMHIGHILAVNPSLKSNPEAVREILRESTGRGSRIDYTKAVKLAQEYEPSE